MNDDMTSNQLDDAGKLVLRLALGILMLFHGCFSYSVTMRESGRD
jgi:hypothetical protein